MTDEEMNTVLITTNGIARRLTEAERFRLWTPTFSDRMCTPEETRLINARANALRQLGVYKHTHSYPCPICDAAAYDQMTGSANAKE
jgi:hypothetical protein